MRRVEFDPSKLTGEDAQWWNDWLPRATKARQEILRKVAAGEKPDFRQAIWSELKSFLLRKVFSEKCAYCEAKVTTVSVGDAEHYRPKAKVTLGRRDSPRGAVLVQGLEHPGYYWLAYSWENLLPSCEKCNAFDGKLNQFPVEGEYVADPEVAISDLDQKEQPLLLHPYRDDPNEHLVFGEMGTVRARDGSLKGEESIRVYKLDRETLNTDRSHAQEFARLRLLQVLGAARTGDEVRSALARFLGPFARGEEPFSSAALAHLKTIVGALNTTVGQPST